MFEAHSALWIFLAIPFHPFGFGFADSESKFASSRKFS